MSSHAAGVAYEMGWKGDKDFVFFVFFLTLDSIAVCEVRIKYNKGDKLKFENQHEILPIPKNIYQRKYPPTFLNRLKEFFVKYQVSK